VDLTEKYQYLTQQEPILEQVNEGSTFMEDMENSNIDHSRKLDSTESQ